MRCWCVASPSTAVLRAMYLDPSDRRRTTQRLASPAAASDSVGVGRLDCCTLPSVVRSSGDAAAESIGRGAAAANSGNDRAPGAEETVSSDVLQMKYDGNDDDDDYYYYYYYAVVNARLVFHVEKNRKCGKSYDINIALYWESGGLTSNRYTHHTHSFIPKSRLTKLRCLFHLPNISLSFAVISFTPTFILFDKCLRISSH